MRVRGHAGAALCESARSLRSDAVADGLDRRRDEDGAKGAPAEDDRPFSTFRGGVSRQYVFFFRVRVSIFRGRIECRFLPVLSLWMSGRLIVHNQPTVVMGRARISVYPYTTWFELIGRDGATVSVYPVGDWAPKRASLVEAGFTVHERVRWI